jgi:hypothetical protein
MAILTKFTIQGRASRIGSLDINSILTDRFYKKSKTIKVLISDGGFNASINIRIKCDINQPELVQLFNKNWAEFINNININNNINNNIKKLDITKDYDDTYYSF